MFKHIIFSLSLVGLVSNSVIAILLKILNGVPVFNGALLSLSLVTLLSWSTTHCAFLAQTQPVIRPELTEMDKIARYLGAKIGRASFLKGLTGITLGACAIPTTVGIILSALQPFLTKNGKILFKQDRLLGVSLIGTYATICAALLYITTFENKRHVEEICKAIAQKLGIEDHEYLKDWLARDNNNQTIVN